jgi:phosphate transport system substrate-binding protein
MKHMSAVAAVVILLAAPVWSAVMINGAGATFPYPIYSKWFDKFHEASAEAMINYQSIGSGGGIRQITEHTVDFGASDAPMTEEQTMKLDGTLLHIPTVLGAVVPVYNLPSVPALNLSGEALADIFLGKITRWNDPALVALNPQAKLPDAAIVVVHRSDGSGTTYCFVDYLAKVSLEWKTKVGRGNAVNWPIGLGGKGNEGVSGLVKLTANSIGYVELVYAKQNNLSHAAMRNKADKFVKADVAAVTSAAAGAAKNMPKDFRVSITDAPGEAAYPISTFTWLLVYEKMGGDKGRIFKNFLTWMLKDGQALASDLGYAPLPANVNAMVAKSVERIK